jgi:uncharacterized protein YegL
MSCDNDTNPIPFFLIVICLIGSCIALVSKDNTVPPVTPSGTPTTTVTSSPTEVTPALPSAPGTKWIAGADTKGITLNANQLQKNIVLVFDCSGSMEGKKLETAKMAINQFARSVPEDVGIGLVTFDNGGVREKVTVGINNRPEFFKAVNNQVAGGGTPLDNAVVMGYKKLRAQALRQLGYGEYHLVIVTDGEANAGHDPTGEVDSIVEDSPVVIHTIGFQIGPNHALNRPGKTIYKEANDGAGLAEGLKEVLAESAEFK